MAFGIWQPRTIKRYFEVMNTSTNVAWVETDEGEGFLKALGNPEGPHVLACELVGTLLAEWLGIPTLDSAIIQVATDDEIPFAGGGLANPGPAFITKAAKGMTWGGDEAGLEEIVNPNDISRLIVLDTWIRNCDRFRPEPRRINYNNVFITRESEQKTFTLRAMDHTHAFTCGRELDRRLNHIGQVRDETLFGCFPAFRRFIRRDTVQECTLRLGQMGRAEAAAVVGLVPTEWQVEDSVREAWRELICDRAGYVAASIEALIWPARAVEEG